LHNNAFFKLFSFQQVVAPRLLNTGLTEQQNDLTKSITKVHQFAGMKEKNQNMLRLLK
jgi:hypothetical protein